MTASIHMLATHSTRRRSPARTIAALLAALTALAGCSVLPKSDPVQLLDPRPAAHAAMATATTGWSLSIARPESDPARDSNRVLIRTADARLQVHSEARWVAPAPDLLRTLAIRHLRDTGALRRVEATGARTDRTLLSDLRRFELAETDGGELIATLEIEFRLYDAATANLIARQVLSLRTPAASASAPDLLRAFESVLSETLKQLTAWLVARPAFDDDRPRDTSTPMR